MSLSLSDDIRLVRMIGDKKAASYQKLGIRTVESLVLHLPRRYLDLHPSAVTEPCEPGSPRLIRATILAKADERCTRRGMSMYTVQAMSDGHPLQLVFYNTRFLVDSLRIDQEYLFYGSVVQTLLRCEMTAPDVIPSELEGTLLPIYPSTAGLSSRVIGQDIRRALDALTEPLPEPLPDWLLQRCLLWNFDHAVRVLHHPACETDCTAARKRIAFGELLIFSTAMLTLRGTRERRGAVALSPCSLDPFWSALPFSPTCAQRAAIEDVMRDLDSPRAMNRLIQGDVGSGKTLIAAAAAYHVFQNGCQTALMAPTELLARQHARTLQTMLAPLGMTVCLMTGAMGIKARRETAAQIAQGEADLVIGTHALLSADTVFSRLALVVTDEQHRFGVAQRAALAAKGTQTHTLVMSATPIPRTLSLILYGDLDVSLIRELPPGRTPVATYRIDGGKRQRAFGYVRDRLDEGRQAYFVCPLVEEGEQDADGLIAATEYAKTIADGAFSNYRVALLHGRMRQRDKDAVMAQFVAGEVQVLVATTVVEVGVDVPNATVMLIENAERFGLSQLHQLRGRVGRGPHPSICVLVSDSKNPQTLDRLRILCKTNDGFRIAEEDLRLRGPGDFLGVRQHGIPGLSNADWLEDPALPTEAQQGAAELLARDVTLQQPEHQGIARAVNALIHSVGELPN